MNMQHFRKCLSILGVMGCTFCFSILLMDGQAGNELNDSQEIDTVNTLVECWLIVPYLGMIIGVSVQYYHSYANELSTTWYFYYGTWRWCFLACDDTGKCV